MLYQQPLITDYEVSEGIYSRARIEEADSVCLWLGANVMLEYSCDEVNTPTHTHTIDFQVSIDYSLKKNESRLTKMQVVRRI